MARYLVSDHHFGHANIIEYCDRPYSSPGEMENALLDNHYETVSPDDVLIHFGDVAMDMQTGQQTIEYFERLGGDLLLRGNHDTGLTPDEAPFPVLESCLLEHDGYEFYCTHRPEDIPDSWDGWAIHGHIHNNDTDVYPFLNSKRKRVNVGVELLNYRPIKLANVVNLINACPPNSKLTDIETAKKKLTE
jgi:calcineurin-like phosphoesterase family protein